MADLERFEFIVPGYTPETMPLDRLIEYLNQLMIILGNPSDLHLVEIKRSSTKPVLLARHDVAVKVRNRAREVWSGGGNDRSQTAFKRIRRMVAEDGGKSAVLQAKEGTIIEFPTVDLGEDQIVSAVRQQTTISGTLIRIGGVAENAQLLIQDFSGEIVSGCTAPRNLAPELGALIYKPIVVHGVGSWCRSAQGKWELSRLHVQSFEPLEDLSIDQVLMEAEAATSNWPDDVVDQLLAMREDAA